MKKQFLVMFLGLCFVGGYSLPAMAQAEGEVAAPAQEQQAATEAADEAGDALVSYGTVTEIGDTKIVLLEYDYDTDQEMQVSYAINPQTTFENVALKSEIVVDDDVESFYTEANGEKTAVNIVKETYDYDFEAEETQGDEPVNAEVPVGNVTSY